MLKGIEFALDLPRANYKTLCAMARDLRERGYHIEAQHMEVLAEITEGMLARSELPRELRRLGYDVQEAGDGQRILASAIVEPVLIEGSTVPIMVTHAGIVRVERRASA